MITDGIGLYIHIPFCKSKCKYCDFASFGGLSKEVRESYISALITEIGSYKREPKIKVNTIFFGGGTPSLLAPHELDKIMRAANECFEISSDAEITVEVNPKTADESKLAAYRSLGINRLSIGLQSIHKNELKILGRIHDFDEFLETYNSARNVGFDNISVDIMYSIPDETPESLGKTLDKLTELSPEHISAYALIIEEGTPFYEMRDILTLPDEDTELVMYRLIRETLAAAGYAHYEISNYSRPGRECRHNLKYWHDEEYIGVGLVAYSYFDGARYGNVRSLDKYISTPTEARAECEEISTDAEAYEFVMMRLRLSEGFSLSEYKTRFGEDFLASRYDKIERYMAAGLVRLENERLFLTEDGFYLSNSILADII